MTIRRISAAGGWDGSEGARRVDQFFPFLFIPSKLFDLSLTATR